MRAAKMHCCIRFVTTLVVVTTVMLSCTTALAAEADWIYQAAGLAARLRDIDASETDAAVKQPQYKALLDECTKLSGAASETGRPAQDRKALSLLIQQHINEALNDVVAARRARDEYAKIMTALPEEERNLISLFERPAFSGRGVEPRLCEVEAKGSEVKVRAMDYPIDDLLRKIAAAVGREIVIPSIVRGYVDWCSQDEGTTEWLTVDSAMFFLGWKHGFGVAVRKDPMRVIVADPTNYVLSLGERADARNRPSNLPPTGATEGISSGYVIVAGQFVPPPYRVEVEVTEGKGDVRINGVPSLLFGPLVPPKHVPVAPPLNGRFEDKGALMAYAGNVFAREFTAHGETEARAQVEALLAKQSIVKSWTINKSWLVITWADSPSKSERLDLASFVTHRDVPDSERREAVLADMMQARDTISASLKNGGLVIASGRNTMFTTYEASTGRKTLLGICDALLEIERQEDRIGSFLPATWAARPSALTWDICFNLRYKEVGERLSKDRAHSQRPPSPPVGAPEDQLGR